MAPSEGGHDTARILQSVGCDVAMSMYTFTEHHNSQKSTMTGFSASIYRWNPKDRTMSSFSTCGSGKEQEAESKARQRLTRALYSLISVTARTIFVEYCRVLSLVAVEKAVRRSMSKEGRATRSKTRCDQTSPFEDSQMDDNGWDGVTENRCEWFVIQLATRGICQIKMDDSLASC